ncbi:diacylglycerol/polyprenol kinase family protein [Longibacter salinarum]|uniref:diacylglycerol/polyprenol kinase family protein n=1 Tax=Longibacter salinarum TaxID=1850348 RepID=UPI001FE86291|nr:hypothetical protein [Longibacter salinarum]
MTEASSDSSSNSTASAPGHSDDRFGYGAEVKRKALHLLALIVPFGMDALGRETALWVLIPLTAIAVGADILRAYSSRVNRLIRTIFGPLMRTEELPDVGTGVVINGATSVLVAATLLTLIFPLWIAVPMFVMTMIADAAAALVGRAVGQYRWPGRRHTVEGTLAFITTGLIVTSFFPLAFPLQIAGVVTASIAEAIPLPINDNIAVPLIASGVVWGLAVAGPAPAF